MDVYKKRVEESQTLCYRLKNIFHMESDFITIWKTTLRIFNIFIIFIFFFKYLLLNVTKFDSYFVAPENFIFIYNMINYMFCVDLVFSVLILIFNGGSKLTYFKLPLKIYVCIPFALKKENFIYLLPKFIRIDIFKKIFSSWENFINLKVELHIHNYNLKIILTCITQIIKYLLIFGLYAHINCCILSYSDNLEYFPSLYYTIEAFTGVGFGEQTPKNIASVILVVLNLFVGVNLFSLMTSNIKNISNKIYSFNRETSLEQIFETNLFHIQKSMGRVLPSNIKDTMHSFLFFRRGLSFKDIKDEFEDVLGTCKNSLIRKIREKTFHFLKLEYQIFFMNRHSDDFIYEIFENLKPKIFRPKQVLIKYGEKVNKLFFLLSGQIFAFNKREKPIYTMVDNSIFGEYEFITNTLSCFTISVDPKREAYGFLLDKDSWEKISNNHILSANEFIKQAAKKRRKHLEWINEGCTIIFEKLPDNKANIDKEEIEINTTELDISKDDRKEEFNKKSNRKDTNLKTPKIDKSTKYNYSNINIIRKIDEFQRKINIMEYRLTENKKDILKHLQNYYL